MADMNLKDDTKMETPERAQCHFSKGLLLTGSQAALHIQKIPEHPQKDQNLLLSVQGIPGTFQDFNWYLGEETNGGTMLFTYFPDLQRPQRDGSAMGQRDIVGFPNGSMMLRRVQPTDSGTDQVAVTLNPDWTMRAKTQVQVTVGICCGPLASLQDTKMETPERAQCHFSKGLLLTASILALWTPQGSQAALHIQKIPEHPQKDQNLLLSVQGIPGTFQDFNWYLGEETNGGTMLFTYFPDLQRPQRDGSAMGQRDIVGFPNGSMMLRRVQPTDSGTDQVAVTLNPDWTMRAKTQVQVSEKLKELPITHLPVSAGIMAAIIIGSLAAWSLFVGCIVHLLLTRGWKGQSHIPPTPGGQGSLSIFFPAVSPVASAGHSPWMTPTEKSEAHPSHNAGDQNIYEVLLSPTFLVSPPGDAGSTNTSMPLPQQQPDPENHPYQELLNPNPAPYCQLVPTP
ncbi:carcinoembryonic antigen-related cell adhesion molecule 19 [Meles meles]|uniref:carcinoembryonic antigen-related cell adhesion molecule 19 n=1 Tax=Meles meles TaxID=9662 RepID=UPI001E69BA08|nr:carcinoembryonic antigen-related cell adhesion molecule 19 [Meles meles]